MSMYRCDECETMIDGDYDPCVEHPTDSTLFCCETCADDIQNEIDLQKEFTKMRAEYRREIEAGLRKKL